MVLLKQGQRNEEKRRKQLVSDPTTYKWKWSYKYYRSSLSPDNKFSEI